MAFAGDYRGYGRIIIIDHDGGWTSLITNLGRLDVAVAARVVQGSPLRAAIRAPWGEDKALRSAIAGLRQAGETVVCVLPGHESEIDEFHCDRALVQQDGQWQVVTV